MAKTAIKAVQVGHRIGLPDFFTAETGDQVIFRELEDGSILLQKKNDGSMIPIYGVVIGENTESKKWWGVFMDGQGNILCRQRATSRDFIRQDLSVPDEKSRAKLDKVCGRGLWQRPPTLITEFEYDILPVKTQKTALKLRRELGEGVWPPKEA